MIIDLFEKRDRLEIALQDAPDIDTQELLGLIAHSWRNIQSLDRLQRLRLEEAQQLKCVQADGQRGTIAGRAARAEHAACDRTKTIGLLGQRLLTDGAVVEMRPVAEVTQQMQLIKAQRQIGAARRIQRRK